MIILKECRHCEGHDFEWQYNPNRGRSTVMVCKDCRAVLASFGPVQLVNYLNDGDIDGIGAELATWIGGFDD